MIYDLYHRTILACETVIECCHKITEIEEGQLRQCNEIKATETNPIVQEAKINKIKADAKCYDACRQLENEGNAALRDLKSFSTNAASECMEELRTCLKQIIARKENPLPPEEKMQLYPHRTGRHYTHIAFAAIMSNLAQDIDNFKFEPTDYLKPAEEDSKYMIRTVIGAWENGEPMSEFHHIINLIDAIVTRFEHHFYLKNHRLMEAEFFIKMLYVVARAAMQNYQIYYQAIVEYTDSVDYQI